MKVPTSRAAALVEYLNTIAADQARARALVTAPMDDAALVEMAIAEDIPVSILRSVSRSLPQ